MKKKIAIVQVPPIFMDLKKTIALCCELIAESAKNKAGLVIFPEAYIPGYPAWIWRLRPSNDFEKAKVMHHVLVENSVDLSKDGLKEIRKAAKNNKITVAIGLNELSIRRPQAHRSTIHLLLLERMESCSMFTGSWFQRWLNE